MATVDRILINGTTDTYMATFPYTIVGYTFVSEIKATPDGTIVATYNIVVDEPSKTATFTIDSVDIATGTNYVYDVIQTNASNQITRLWGGSITVNQAVSV